MKKTLLVLAVTVLAAAGSSTAAFAGHYCSRGYARYAYYPAPVYAPVYVVPVVPYYRPAVVYRSYWHRHYYGGRYIPCHYYGGIHHYDRTYGPRIGFHVGVSIFR